MICTLFVVVGLCVCRLLHIQDMASHGDLAILAFQPYPYAFRYGDPSPYQDL